MTTVATQPPVETWTPEDLLRLPDASGYELVDGKLLVRHVSIESSRIATEIARLLGNESNRTREATVYGADLGYQCFPDDPDRVRKPDVSAIRAERLAAVAGDAGYMPIAADLAVEVVSPNDVSYEVAAKVEQYLAAGFGAVWVAHPNVRTVTTYRPGGASAVLHENDEIAADPALPAFRCRVGEFFKP